MLSSWQIAQIHSQQGQQFSAQQAYGQQLSARMPAPYQGAGLGATGFGGGFGQQGGGYNYGSSYANSYGPGNSFGNSATSAIGGLGHAIGSAGGIAGAIGGGLMGGFGGAMTGFMGGGMIGGAIKHISNSFMEGGQEQASIERTLSQFQHQNAGSRTGSGFNRNDSMQIGNMVRQMERMPEMLTSFSELNRLMDKMGQMGLMQGVKDAGDFMRKFRDTTTVLKDMAKMMGTSMEGALQAFGEARTSGFYSKTDIAKNIIGRQVTASLTGMNQGQIGGLQNFGAEMSHSLGGSRAGGAKNMLRTMGQLGMANQMGILSNDQIVEMTGKEGAEGLQDLSGQMSQLSYQMGRSNVGQALTLALGQQENGRYTGKMDQELVEKVRRGELSLEELKSMARSKAGTRTAKLSFAAHRKRLQTEMAGAVGSEGVAMQLQEILGEKGWQNPDAQNLVMQRFGASEEQANLLQKMMPNLQDIGSKLSLAGRQETSRSAQNAARQEHGWDAIKHRIGTKIGHYTTDWAKDLGVGVRDYFQGWADDFIDDLSGQYREYVTTKIADTVRFSMAGSASNKASLSAMSSRASKFASGFGAGRMDVGAIGDRADAGMFSLSKNVGSRIAHLLGGGQTAGERATDVLGGLDKGQYLEKGQVHDLEQRGASVLQSDFWTKSGTGITQSGAAGAMRRLQQLGTDTGGMKEWEKALKVSGGGDADLRNAYQQAMQRGDIQLESDPAKRADLIWEEMRRRVPSEMMDKLEKSSMGRLNIIAGVQAAERKSGNRFAGALDFEGLGKGTLGGLDLKNQAAIGRAIEEQDKRMSKALSGSDTMSSWAEVRKMLDGGSQMTSLLVGNEKYRGLTSGGAVRGESINGVRGNTPDASGMTVRNIAAKNPQDWTDKDRAVLKDLGVDSDKLAAEIAKNPEGWQRLQQAAASGKLTEDEIAKYVLATDASGLNKISNQLNKQGGELASRLKGENYRSARESLSATKEGKEVLAMLGGLGSDLQGVNAANIGKFTDSTADIAGKLSGLSKEQRKIALDLGGDELRGAYGYRQNTKGKLRQGMGVDQILSAGGMNLGSTESDMRFKKDLEGMLHGKGGTLAGGDMDAVLKLLTGNAAGGLRTASGISSSSSHMSEQEVSNNLKSLSENNVKMATILGNLAGGKSGDKLLDGYSAPKS